MAFNFEKSSPNSSGGELPFFLKNLALSSFSTSGWFSIILHDAGGLMLCLRCEFLGSVQSVFTWSLNCPKDFKILPCRKTGSFLSQVVFSRREKKEESDSFPPDFNVEASSEVSEVAGSETVLDRREKEFLGTARGYSPKLRDLSMLQSEPEPESSSSSSIGSDFLFAFITKLSGPVPHAPVFKDPAAAFAH
jgi:hypothetical protein